jgi:transcriptional regulator with XRE-family HTH domain
MPLSEARIKAGERLRARIGRLGLSYAEAARRLGLTADGLQKKMRGDRPIGRQTEIILAAARGRPAARRFLSAAGYEAA